MMGDLRHGNLREISDDELNKTIKNHLKWKETNGKEGEIADFTNVLIKGKDLSYLELNEAIFKRASIEDVNLEGTILIEANMDGALINRTNLKYSDLCKTDLINAIILESNFEEAFLKFMNISNTNCLNCNFSKALLQSANFENSCINNSNFKKSFPIHTNMKNADLSVSNFESANLAGSNLENAKLYHSNLNNTILNDANLTKADLRHVKGLALDSNFISNTRFSYNANDRWSKLRRAYTGPMFFLHLLILLSFFSPYVLKAMMWYGVSQTEHQISEFNSNLTKIVEQNSNNNQDVTNQKINNLLIEVDKLLPNEENGWRKFSIWQVLLAVDKGILFWALTLVLIFYNILRGLMTYRISLLRDEEERSKFSPAKKDYWNLYYLHYVIKTMMVIAFCSFLYHLYFWLTAPVLLPPI